MTNISMPSKKAPAKLKSVSKPKLAAPRPSTNAPLLVKHEAARERQPLTLRLLPSEE